MTQSQTNTTQEGSRQGLVRALWLVKEEHSYAFICERLIHAAQTHQAGCVTTPSPFLLLKNQQGAYDMQGKQNQTQLCMNECGYVGFGKIVCWR